jgi:glyoxylase-like metal-dependent hydrolase (beta-lactamase superfamily II)
MSVHGFTAGELFELLTGTQDFLLLDVRNPTEFERFKVEGPRPIDMINVPYMDFIEHEDESVAKVPSGKPIRAVCAKEGSSKFVTEILAARGYVDLGHLLGGIKAWGNLLTPVLLHGKGYELYQFRRPGKASCSYGLVYGGEMAVFDPSRNVEFYQQFAADRGVRVVKSFETHKQADYISGGPALAREHGVEMLGNEADFGGAAFPFTPVKDGEVFRLASDGPEIKALHTPGHTPGSTCYLIDGKFLISGDTVFIESVGRPDLGGQAEAWSKYLFHTLMDVIKKLPPTTQVLPAHWMDWSEARSDLAFAATLDAIIKRNLDIFSLNDEAAFYGFIKENMRPQPPEYAIIREINAGLREETPEQQEILDLGKNECAASARAAAAAS